MANVKTEQFELGDIKKDLSSGVITAEQFYRAIINPKRVKFFNDPKTIRLITRIEFENGVTRDYELYSVIGVIQKLIDSNALEPLSSVRLAFLDRYDSLHKIPDNANKDVVKRDIAHGNQLIDDATAEKIKYDGIEIVDEQEREEYRKEVAERIIIEAFMHAFFMIDAYGKTFGSSPIKEKIVRYVDGVLDLCVQMAKECNWVDEEMGAVCISMVFRKDSYQLREYSKTMGVKALTDDEVIKFLEKYVTREEFEQFVASNGDCIIDRKKVMKYITTPGKKQDTDSKEGIITPDEFKKIVSKKRLVEMYRFSPNREILQYMLPNQILEVFADGLVENNDFYKFIKFDDIFTSDASPEIKKKVLERCGRTGIFVGDKSREIWKMLESGDLTVDDVKALEPYGYLKVESIISQYTENTRRKIAEELGEVQAITDEKLFEFFTPDIIIREASKSKNDGVCEFIIQTLKTIYEKHEISMEEAVTEELIKGNKTELVQRSFDLYKSGIVSVDIFKRAEIGNADLLHICRENIDDERLLIDVFNNKLISQDDMIDILGDNFDEVVFDLISKGMSARIIEGYYATMQLIEMTRPLLDEDGNELPPKLTYENLAEIKGDIEIGIDTNGTTKKGKSSTTLLDLYLSDRLSYSELYDMVKTGVISLDIANMINEKYNLIKDWDKLKEKGVEGKSILDMSTPTPGPGPITSGDVVGIDEGCIIDYYIAMGAKEYLEIDPKKCPVFKDYIVIPIIEKKVAYMESADGRTYIVPLKIVLEQINNPNGQMDLIGNARSRKEFNRQKAHIRSVNHTRNWGRKVAQKTADLPSVPFSMDDAKEFIRVNHRIISAIENSYDSRKLAMIQRNNQTP